MIDWTKAWASLGYNRQDWLAVDEQHCPERMVGSTPGTPLNGVKGGFEFQDADVLHSFPTKWSAFLPVPFPGVYGTPGDGARAENDSSVQPDVRSSKLDLPQKLEHQLAHQVFVNFYFIQIGLHRLGEQKLLNHFLGIKGFRLCQGGVVIRITSFPNWFILVRKVLWHQHGMKGSHVRSKGNVTLFVKDGSQEDCHRTGVKGVANCTAPHIFRFFKRNFLKQFTVQRLGVITLEAHQNFTAVRGQLVQSVLRIRQQKLGIIDIGRIPEWVLFPTLQSRLTGLFQPCGWGWRFSSPDRPRECWEPALICLAFPASAFRQPENFWLRIPQDANLISQVMPLDLKPGNWWDIFREPVKTRPTDPRDVPTLAWVRFPSQPHGDIISVFLIHLKVLNHSQEIKVQLSANLSDVVQPVCQVVEQLGSLILEMLALRRQLWASLTQAASPANHKAWRLSLLDLAPDVLLCQAGDVHILRSPRPGPSRSAMAFSIPGQGSWRPGSPGGPPKGAPPFPHLNPNAAVSAQCTCIPMAMPTGHLK